jgi:hypothetical protein
LNPLSVGSLMCLDSYLPLNLALFCDFMSSFRCSLLACEEAAQAREQSLTKRKK